VIEAGSRCVPSLGANPKIVFLRDRDDVRFKGRNGNKWFALSLALLHVLSARPAKSIEVAVLVAANLVATIVRFVLLRGWVFRERRSAPLAEEVP